MNKFIITALIGIVISAGGLFYSSRSGVDTTPVTQVVATASKDEAAIAKIPPTEASQAPRVTVPPSGTVFEDSPRAAAGAIQTEVEVQALGGIVIPIKIGERTYSPRVAEGASVLDAMDAAAPEGLSYSGRHYMGLGLRVDEINGVRSDNGYYWFLYVNGTSSNLGASQTTLKHGDEIEWRYTQSY